MRECSLRELHEILLMGYVTVVEELLWAKPNTDILISNQENISARWLDSIRHMDSAYLMTGRVWQKVFSILDREEWRSDSDEKGKILGIVFEKWRGMDGLEARLEWARWLLENGRGKEATTIMMVGGREEERLELEKRWVGVLEKGREAFSDSG